jgi:hypothetical protein
MKPFNYQTVAVAAVLALAILVPAVIARGTMIEGTVMSTSPGALLIMARSGDPVEFAVPNGARIIRDGEPAQLDELQSRDQVSVAASENGQERVATDIFARSPF